MKGLAVMKNVEKSEHNFKEMVLKSEKPVNFIEQLKC